MFLEQFNQPLIYILIGASIITAFLKEWVDSLVIFGVVMVNATISFLQEAKARKAIESLGKSISKEANVIRDGKRQRIPASQLTIGDIVFLQSGDKAPADIRLTNIRELQVDESALTGESVPVIKTLKDIRGKHSTCRTFKYGLLINISNLWHWYRSGCFCRKYHRNWQN